MGKVISIYGPAAAGKTTQAVKIKEKYNLCQFSMGDTLRDIINSGSELGKKLKYQVENGILIDDELMIQVLHEVPELAKQGIVFDGFPRMLSQAKMLEEVLQGSGAQLEKVFLLKLSEDDVMRRIAARSQVEQRIDDLDPKAVAKRIAIFNQESQGLIDLYRQQGILVEIDGALSIEEVFAEICRHLD
ncbi:MAG TPA: nucleoside monophosphate kinase [bacterium]|nr:nucleoside monophosphate kinase [bacterium]HPT29677.1 nucleoside monophosphate kinase [bacterium]